MRPPSIPKMEDKAVASEATTTMTVIKSTPVINSSSLSYEEKIIIFAKTER